MTMITVMLDQEQIDRAQQLADRLSDEYGTKVSRSSVIRRAIMAYTPLELKDTRNEKNDSRPSRD